MSKYNKLKRDIFSKDFRFNINYTDFKNILYKIGSNEFINNSLSSVKIIKNISCNYSYDGCIIQQLVKYNDVSITFIVTYKIMYRFNRFIYEYISLISKYDF